MHHYFSEAFRTNVRLEDRNPSASTRILVSTWRGSGEGLAAKVPLTDVRGSVRVTIAFSKCGSVGGGKGWEAHQLSCVALDLLF
jgi:hypothetical protein